MIIGFGLQADPRKLLFDYETPTSKPQQIQVNRINAYLVHGANVFVEKRRHPEFGVPEVTYGSFALDDGNFTLSEEDRNDILDECPQAARYIRPFIGGKEMLHDIKRYCLWLKNADPADIRNMAPIGRRVDAVQRWRAASGRPTTRKLAATPTLFAEIRQPTDNYLAFPTLSSVNRTYIPVSIFTADIIASNQIYVIAKGDLFAFGVLSSLMHMAWVRSVGGRFKSDYRYSAGIVYNNYPWPRDYEKNKKAVELAAQDILDTRAQFPGSILADLYHSHSMPPELVKAHQKLDRAVDRCYRAQPFTGELNRLEFLFDVYKERFGGIETA